MATWNGVITNAGNRLLNEWVNEKTLNFDSAASGQGTVAEVAMMAQTALVNEKQVASLLGGEKVASGIRLKLRIAAPDTAYTLNQFRVSASVDGGSPAMLALFQLEQGIPIPSKTESPDFVYTFYALISCSNTGTWTVTVDTSACVTQGDMTAAITEAVRTKQDKLTGTPGQVVGFDEEGNAVPQAGGGVMTFNGRSGAVVPAEGDYTAEMVGARPESWIPSAADTGAVPITEKGAPNGVATLGPDGKVPAGQLPKMDYDPAGSAEAVQQALTAHTGNKNNPHAVTAEQVGALASSGGVMSGAISMSGHKIANLAAPADSTDAANKQYVDEHAGARVILGSYVGTGKTGKSNPNQITLAEPFKILCIYGMQSNNYYKSIDGYGNGETSNIIHSSIIPTEYTKGISFGFGYRYSSRDSYGKKSTDGKTFSWYFDLTTPDATSEQLNASGTVYYYYAIV